MSKFGLVSCCELRYSMTAPTSGLRSSTLPLRRPNQQPHRKPPPRPPRPRPRPPRADPPPPPGRLRCRRRRRRSERPPKRRGRLSWLERLGPSRGSRSVDLAPRPFFAGRPLRQSLPPRPRQRRPPPFPRPEPPRWPQEEEASPPREAERTPGGRAFLDELLGSWTLQGVPAAAAAAFSPPRCEAGGRGMRTAASLQRAPSLPATVSSLSSRRGHGTSLAASWQHLPPVGYAAPAAS
mmetsp:Transcript_86968/g.225936  ORF Transcript_86968/g.225936 Transcript_86968/m.225936 type:complete len:237 (+) Transcript_86968:244-954(+)